MADTTLPDTNDTTDQSSDGEGLIAVQLDTLLLHGIPPQTGDSVKFTVQGTVDHVDEQEGCAYVKPEKANGKDIPQQSDDEQEPDETDLENKAQAADKEKGYA